jgi:hypothetical protein
LNMIIGDPVQTATSRIRSSSGSGNAHWPPAETDLHEAGTAAEVLCQVVYIDEGLQCDTPEPIQTRS